MRDVYDLDRIDEDARAAAGAYTPDDIVDSLDADREAYVPDDEPTADEMYAEDVAEEYRRDAVAEYRESAA